MKSLKLLLIGSFFHRVNEKEKLSILLHEYLKTEINATNINLENPNNKLRMTFL